jgi:DNA-binding transcriptional ArsR family regulator
MSLTMEEKNAMLRHAVEQRRESQAAGKPLEEWYGDTEPMPEETSAEVSSHSEETYMKHLSRWAEEQDEIDEALERLRGDGITHEQRPGSLPFLELLEELRQLHFQKTAQYGGSTDPFENVTASAKCGVEPWRRALCDLSDCVVRMQRFANGQPVDYENALIDAANWSLICLLKLREDKRG